MNQGIEQISDEILLQIFSSLPHKDILKVGQVSKRFYRITQDASLHRQLSFGASGENLHLSANVLRSYMHKHGAHLESFVFLDCYWLTQTQLGRLLRPCKNLREMNLIGCEISLKSLDVFFQHNKQLKKLGWSIPSKDFSIEIFNDEGDTPMKKRIVEGLQRLKSLKLRFFRLYQFEIIVGLFPVEMYLNELCMEYKGQKATSIIHAGYGADYNVHICSKQAFPAYGNKLNFLHNQYLHFNLVMLDFVTKVVHHASETDQLTVLLAPGSRNSLCWKYIAPSYRTSLLTMIDLSSSCLIPEQMNWLGSLENVTFLNLQHVQNFKLNLMKSIAKKCKNLVSLNLNDCADWLDEDLCALKVLGESCHKLRHLNLGKICCHSESLLLGNLFSLRLSAMKQLRALAVTPCSLVNPENDCGDGPSPVQSPELKLKRAPARRSGLAEPSSHCTSANATLASIGYVTRYVTHQREFNERVLEHGSGLDQLVQELKEIDTFELVDVGYSSAFSIPDDSSGLSFVCPRARSLQDASLLSMQSWTKLKTLTLAGLPGLGSFKSLIEITAHCKNIEYLSLSNIGLPGHSGALTSLPQALKNCKNLRKFRLDQPHYHVTDRLFLSMHDCKRLEAACIICKDAKIPKELPPYAELFDACPSLCVFQLYSGAAPALCKNIQKGLIKRYQNPRPPLSVVILHYSQCLTEDGLQNIPYAHLKNLTCFESKVATIR